MPGPESSYGSGPEFEPNNGDNDAFAGIAEIYGLGEDELAETEVVEPEADGSVKTETVEVIASDGKLSIALVERTETTTTTTTVKSKGLEAEGLPPKALEVFADPSVARAMSDMASARRGVVPAFAQPAEQQNYQAPVVQEPEFYPAESVRRSETLQSDRWSSRGEDDTELMGSYPDSEFESDQDQTDDLTTVAAQAAARLGEYPSGDDQEDEGRGDWLDEVAARADNRHSRAGNQPSPAALSGRVIESRTGRPKRATRIASGLMVAATAGTVFTYAGLSHGRAQETDQSVIEVALNPEIDVDSGLDSLSRFQESVSSLPNIAGTAGRVLAASVDLVLGDKE